MPAPAEPSNGTVGWQSSWLKPILDSLFDSKVPALSLSPTSTLATALAINTVNPTDATAGPITRALPTGVPGGSLIVIAKTDASANTVTVTGNLRGIPNATLSLYWQNETVLLLADSSGTYWPLASHKTKTSMDAAYITTAGKGVANGVASLDATAHLPVAQLPTNTPTFATYPDEQTAAAAGLAGSLANVTFVMVG